MGEQEEPVAAVEAATVPAPAPTPVPGAVLEALEVELPANQVTDRLDHGQVARALAVLGHAEAATWIREHPIEWRHGIAHGFTSE